MGPLFPESVGKNNKKANLTWHGHLVGGGRRAASPAESPANLLYKPIVISAASPRGEIAGDLSITAADCSFLPARSGPRAQARRSPAEAGHDPAKQRTEEEIHR